MSFQDFVSLKKRLELEPPQKVSYQLSIVWDKACLVCTKKKTDSYFQGRYWLVTNSLKSLPSGWAFLASLGQLLRKTTHQQAQMAEKHTCYAPHKVGKHTPPCKLPAVKRCRFATNRSSNWNEPQKEMRENYIDVLNSKKTWIAVIKLSWLCNVYATPNKKDSGGFCWWTPPPKKWSFRKWIVFCPFCKIMTPMFLSNHICIFPITEYHCLFFSQNTLFSIMLFCLNICRFFYLLSF